MNAVTRLLAAALFVGTACRRSEGAGGGSAGGNTGSSGSDEAREITMSAAAIQHGGVRWEPAATRAVAAVTEVPGQLVPNEDSTARLGAPAQARVVSVHVQVGDRVSRGRALVTLQSPAASTARADYDKAVADLNARRSRATYARTARERAERLLAAKAISRQELERTQADDELAKAELAQAEAESTRTRSALFQLGLSPGSDVMAMRAPLSGVVLGRDAVPGAVVEAGAPLVSVSNPSTLWLDIAATDRAASGMRVGGRVRFGVPAFPVDTFTAKVLSVGGALDPATRTVPVRALVQNGGNRLRAQMFATVWLEATEGGGGTTSIAVPESAVMLLDERPVVFVAHPLTDGTGIGSVRFERRDVEIGGKAGGVVRILRGVTAGDLIVTEGAFAVKSEFSRSKMPPQ